MNKKVVGIIIFVLLIFVIIGIKVFNTQTEDNELSNQKTENLIQVYVATGGGKEDFIADERVNEIMHTKYGINVIYDTWSNGKMVKNKTTT